MVGNRARLRASLVLVVAIGVVSAVPLASSGASPAAPRCDFDADGDADLPVGVPGEFRHDVVDAGMLQVFEGNPDGFDPAADKRFWQGAHGIKGVAERRDEFGSELACGDFDADGYWDLAIGSNRERVNGKRYAGQVNVLYGGPNGLSGVGDQLWTQSSPGIKGAAQKWDGFGFALTVGDFDGNGIHDLAIGAPWERITGHWGAGAVNVLYGTNRGLTAEGSDLLHQNVKRVLDTVERGDNFGFALAAGDFDGDGDDDLAVGARTEGIGDVWEAGMVQVFPGSPTGLTKDDTIWHRGVAGIEGDLQAYAEFGYALASGRLNADGYDDLVVGVYGDNDSAGSITVLYGGPNGFDGNDALWAQGVGEVPGPAERSDRFGEAVAVGDFNGDGIDDVAVGAPYEGRSGGVDSGDVTVLYGSPRGITDAGSEVWHQGRRSLEGDLVRDNLFGSYLSALDLDGDGHDDLVVGAWATGGVDLVWKGELHMIPGSASGLTGKGDVRWDQDTPGVLGVAQWHDRFGEGLP